MATPLTAKVFCVTGAGSGIGLATTKALLSLGSSVSMTDISRQSLEDFYNDLSPPEQERTYKQDLDVGNRQQVGAFLEATKRHFGYLNGIVNSAGTPGRFIGTHSIWELPSAEFDLVMNANVRGTFNLLAESLRPGFLTDDASIVNVGSTASARGIRNGSPYSASKHAVVGLTKSVAQEVGARGIRVNVVLP